MHAISPKSKEAYFNKELIKNRFGSAANTYVANAIVQKEMAVSLVQMASQHINIAQKQK